MKIERQITKEGEIAVSRGYPGKTHAFKIRKSKRPLPQNATVLADSGQGLQKLHSKTILPYKQQQQPLTPDQKTHHSSLASQRIRARHLFSWLKKFKILDSVYRNFRKKLHLRFNIIVGIYNLKLS